MFFYELEVTVRKGKKERDKTTVSMKGNGTEDAAR